MSKAGWSEQPRLTLWSTQRRSAQQSGSLSTGAIGFGSAAKAKTAGLALAERFGAAMDHHSKPALLLVSVHEGEPQPNYRRIILWTFPQQAVFRLRAQGAGAAIDVLDVFSRESKLRKAAMFVGGSGPTDLLTGRALDFQASVTDRAVADLWIVKFLEAKLQMSSDEGTRLLARSLRHAHDRFRDEPDRQAEVQAVIVQLRQSTATRITLGQVAGQLECQRWCGECGLVGLHPDPAGCDGPVDDDRVQHTVPGRAVDERGSERHLELSAPLTPTSITTSTASTRPHRRPRSRPARRV
jgi:hypothetical protein